MSESHEPIDMLVFGAHPDDAEIGMGGTIAKHAAHGLRIAICDLTLAELSSNGDVHTRQEEAKKAAQVLGVVERSNLRLPDRGLEQSRAQLDAVTLEIRRTRPRIVFAPYWQDRHPDHVACSRLVREAVFNAKLRNLLPEAEPWTVERLLFYFINDTVRPDIAVDVSEHYDQKRNALLAYRSQFMFAGTDQVRTPLNQGYLEHVEARDRVMGQQYLVRYAEGFVSAVPYLLDRLL